MTKCPAPVHSGQLLLHAQTYLITPVHCCKTKVFLGWRQLFAMELQLQFLIQQGGVEMARNTSRRFTGLLQFLSLDAGWPDWAVKYKIELVFAAFGGPSTRLVIWLRYYSPRTVHTAHNAKVYDFLSTFCKDITASSFIYTAAENRSGPSKRSKNSRKRSETRRAQPFGSADDACSSQRHMSCMSTITQRGLNPCLLVLSIPFSPLVFLQAHDSALTVEADPRSAPSDRPWCLHHWWPTRAKTRPHYP